MPEDERPIHHERSDAALGVVVRVAAADAHRGDAHQHLAAPRDGHGAFGEAEVADAVQG
ncbi:hypothetical protein FM106_07195 [Brachybacterium faecium]|nr:hypothetical protein FM106_07195 [Brachybacterium faecium]